VVVQWLAIALLATLFVSSFVLYVALTPSSTPIPDRADADASVDSAAARQYLSLEQHTAALLQEHRRHLPPVAGEEAAQTHVLLQHIVIITAGLDGAVLGGGIGTAYSALTRTLAAAGHTVQVLYVPYPAQQSASSSSSVSSAVACTNYTELALLYSAAAPASISIDELLVTRSSANVSCLLPPPTDLQHRAAVSDRVVRGCPSYACARSYHTYRWLRAYLHTNADAARHGVVVHVQDNAGLGFFISQAHALRTLPAPIVLGSHAPHLWQRLANGATTASISSEDAELDAMERATTANVDWLVSPSRYMLGWMEEQDWTLPSHVAVQPNLLPQSPTTAEVKQRAHELVLVGTTSVRSQPLNEVVFFGRLELRKGLFLFLDALQLLLDSGLWTAGSPVISFLGPDTHSGREWMSQIVRDRCRQLALHCVLLTNLSRYDSLAYLVRHPQPPPLVVIGSPVDNSPYTVLECLTLGVPFLAANVGGIPELVIRDMQPHDAEQLLFEPTAQRLAERIRDTVNRGVRWLPLVSRTKDESAWQRWHRALPPAPLDEADFSASPIPGNHEQPRLSIAVCIAHPGSMKQLHEVVSIMLEQRNVLDAYSLQLVVVRVLDEQQRAAQKEGGNDAVDAETWSELVAAIVDSGWTAELLTAPAAVGAETSSTRQRWTATQVSSDYYLFLAPRHALHGRTSLVKLMRVAARSGADVISAAVFDAAHRDVLLDSSCALRPGGVSKALSRSVLVRRAIVQGKADVEQDSEGEGGELSSVCVPEPLFATLVE